MISAGWRLRQVTLAFATLIAFVSFSSPAHAAGIDSKGFVGGIFGLNIPDAEDTSARPAFGIVGGAKLGTEWSVGGYYLTSSKEEENDANQKFDFDYSMYGIEGAYHFEGEAAGVYVGARLGLTSLDVGAADYSPYHWGLLVGYNHWLTDNFSLGGEASFINVASDDDTVNGAKISSDSFNIIGFMASAKFWF